MTDKTKRKNDDSRPLSCFQIAAYLILFTSVMMIMALVLGGIIR